MSDTLTASEEAQLSQTVEMFEVITQSQPQDYQSLEILKEAYLKLNLDKEVVLTSKRIAQAYVQLGQLSSAILEYETILQRHPEDADAMAAMAQIESKANNLTSMQQVEPEPVAKAGTGKTSLIKKEGDGAAQAGVDDGRQSMYKFFVQTKLIGEGDFQTCWPMVDLNVKPTKAVEPFIHNLAERQIMPLEKSLKVLSDRSRMAYIPLERYDMDMDLIKAAPRDICQRWCMVPIDRMSKSIMVATANPFNKKAIADLEDTVKYKILWYLASPSELMRVLNKSQR